MEVEVIVTRGGKTVLTSSDPVVVAAVEGAIVALLNGTSKPPEKTEEEEPEPEPAPKPQRYAQSRKGVGNRKPRLKCDWALGEKLWDEGMPTKELSERLGIPEKSLLNGAAYRGWSKRSRKVKLSVEGKKTPRRRCDSCQLIATRDPCEHCKTPMLRQ